MDGFHTTNGWSKAWENSYQERSRGFLLGGTSLAVLIIFRKLGRSNSSRYKRTF